MAIYTDRVVATLTYNGANIEMAGSNPPQGNIEINATDTQQTGINVYSYATASVNPTPSEEKETSENGIVAPSQGKLLSKVTVNVPTGPAKTSSDLVVNGATVTAPAGLYNSNASKSVASGTAGKPTVSKSIDLDAHQATITSSVTNTTGYITGSTISGNSTTVTASELVSGSIDIISNIEYDVSNYSKAIGKVPVNTIVCLADDVVQSSSYTKMGSLKLIIPQTGKYTISWMGWRSTSTGTSGTRLYINNTQYGTYESFTGYGQRIAVENVNITQSGTTIELYARSSTSLQTMRAGNLIAQKTDE